MLASHLLNLHQFGLNLFNVLVASLIVSMIGLMTAYIVRNQRLSFRHGLLCMTLLATLTSPLLSTIAGTLGHGLVPLRIGNAKSDFPDKQLPELPQSRQLNGPGPGERKPSSEVDSIQANPKRALVAPAGVVSDSPADRSNRGLQSFPTHPAIWLAIVWAAGALFVASHTVRGLLAIGRLQRSLKLSSNPRLIAAAKKALAAAAQDVNTPICESLLAPAPLTFGWWQGTVVMPQGLVDSLDDEQLVCVLAHEVAHIARHDNLFTIIQELAGIVFWWNPAVHCLNRQIELLREQLCDDHVVQHFGNGLSLAHAIIKVIESTTMRESTLPLVATLADGYEAIETRITRLADQGRPISTGLNRKSSVLVGLFTVMLCGVAFIPVLRTEVLASPKDDVVTMNDWKIRVHAVDLDGKPITKVQFGIQLGHDVMPKWVDADLEGRATLEIPEQNPKYCALLSRADGYVTMRATWHKGVIPDDGLPMEFTFEVPTAITVGGIVVNENGMPVPDAKVEFSAEISKSSAVQPVLSPCYKEVATTDKDGKWRCKTAPAEMQCAWINVAHPDYFVDRTFSTGHVITDHFSKLLDFSHRWTLKKGFRVTGVVGNEEGKPVAGASLAICQSNSPCGIPVQKTDAEGRFVFDRIEIASDFVANDPISLTISVLKPGYAPMIETVPGFGGRPLEEDSTKNERICNFTLSKGVPLTLKIVDSKNNPVKKAWINPASWHDTRALETLRQHGIPQYADDSGVWRWEDAPPGERILFSIDAKEFAMKTNHGVLITDKGAEETILLKRAQIILGNVTDARTKLPIPKFVVERAFEDVGGYPDGLYWTGQYFDGKEGKYRGSVNMTPGTGRYTFRALADGYEPAVSQSTLFKEGEETIDFKLQLKKK